MADFGEGRVPPLSGPGMTHLPPPQQLEGVPLPQGVSFSPGKATIVGPGGGTFGYNAEEVRSYNDKTGAEKGVKLARYDLVPTGPLRLLAEHYGKGAQKYAERNWELGIDWSKLYAAAMRHLTQFWAGEDIDEETGTPHVISAAWMCFALCQMMEQHPELDDRPKGNDSEQTDSRGDGEDKGDSSTVRSGTSTGGVGTDG